MSKDPAVLLYTADFLVGVQDLTMQERGEYITMLCLQHLKGHLTDKEIKLAVGNVSEDVLKKFSTDENGLYYNERMDLEIEKRENFSKSRSENGKKGGRPQKSTSFSVAKANQKLGENVNRNINSNVNTIIEEKGGVGEKEDANAVSAFSAFWAAYPKKRNKQDAFEAFVKLDPDDALLGVILGAVEDQKTWEDWKRDEGKYIPLPSTWLNNRRWEDEPTEIVAENPKPRYGNFDPHQAFVAAVKKTYGET